MACSAGQPPMLRNANSVSGKTTNQPAKMFCFSFLLGCLLIRPLFRLRCDSLGTGHRHAATVPVPRPRSRALCQGNDTSVEKACHEAPLIPPPLVTLCP